MEPSKVNKTSYTNINNQQTNISLPELPTEIWVNILSYCSFEDRQITKLVSKQLKNSVWVTTECLVFDPKLSFQELEAAIIQISHLDHNLKILNLSNTQLTDVCLQELSSLKDLTTLDLSGCKQLTAVGLKQLASLKGLTDLNLSGCNQLTDVGLKELAVHFKSLIGLSLTGCNQLTNVGLKELASLKNLTRLNLSWCKWLTNVGLKELAALKGLTHLNLNQCHQLTDVGLKQLASLKGLTDLNLSGCHQLTYEGLKELSGLKCFTSHLRRIIMTQTTALNSEY